MYEEGMAARKISYFDPKLLSPFKEWLNNWNWDPTEQPRRYLRKGDDTYLIYLPVNKQRSTGFAQEMQGYPIEITYFWNDVLEPLLYQHIVPLTEINDPIIVQADIARMRPFTGDTLMHTDTRYNQRYARRYNIAIDTNDNCWLYHHSYDLDKGGIRDHINEGELWELNNKIPHTAVNWGNTWRTHFIIDIMPRNYWQRMCELYDPYAKVPNPLKKNNTFDLDLNGNLIHEPLFNDLPHCFPARTAA